MIKSKSNIKVNKPKSKVTIKKTQSVKINKPINSDFIKIYPTDGGGVTSQPKCDIRSLDVVQGVVTDERGKQKVNWYLTFNLINGDVIVDRTPYKTMEKAEKVMDGITASLPKPQPITTIQQPVPIATSQSSEEYQQVGEAAPMGFRIDDEPEEEDYE